MASDEPDKTELLERWERHPGVGGVLEARFPEEGVISLIKCCNKGPILGESLPGLAAGGLW